MPVTRWSDHAPLWDLADLAVMVADTVSLRDSHCHRPTDTPATLVYAFMTRVA